MPHTPAMPHVVSREDGPHTWDDFIRLGEDDLRELIDGELVEVEVPTNAHEAIVALLIELLGHWAKTRHAGRVLGSAYKLRISAKKGVMPDVQFYRAGNLPRGQSQGLVEGHPDLVVEVVSKTSARYDRVKKLSYYALLGVPEYWIVVPAARTLERLVLETGRYAIAEALADDEVLRPATFEGLEVPLAELWQAVDELERDA
jgi:Uma2 family endonuclease